MQEGEKLLEAGPRQLATLQTSRGPAATNQFSHRVSTRMHGLASGVSTLRQAVPEASLGSTLFWGY